MFAEQLQAPQHRDDDAAVRRLVRIDGTSAAAFGALLHFVYADALPAHARRNAAAHGCAELRAFCVEYIARPEVLRQVVRTEGYAELKASHPRSWSEWLPGSTTTRRRSAE